MGAPAQQSDDATIRHEDDGDLGADETPAPGSERVIYRDVEEFNKALDAAADSIAKAKGHDLLGHIIWWGTIIFTGFLYGAGRIFSHVDLTGDCIDALDQ